MDNKIGKFIATLRREAGLTQQDLGNKLYVTDKAVSKWERGLSLPDITLLTKIAEIFGVDVTELIQGTKSVKKHDVTKILEDEKKKLENYNRKRMIKIIVPLLLMIIILIILLFKSIYLGYDLKTIKFARYDEVIDADLGVPKFSFDYKSNVHNYSFKNFRSAQVLESEIKKYLQTLKYLSCNNSIYYYDEVNNLSIVDYSVKDKLFYSTISYGMVDGDYCLVKRFNEQSEIIGNSAFHSKNMIYYEGDNLNGELSIVLLHDITRDYKNKASLEIYKLKEFGKGSTTIEVSKGTYFINDDKFIYYRDEISDGIEKNKVPKISTFTIKDQKLILDDNYLSSYLDEVVLEIEK